MLPIVFFSADSPLSELNTRIEASGIITPIQNKKVQSGKQRKSRIWRPQFPLAFASYGGNSGWKHTHTHAPASIDEWTVNGKTHLFQIELNNVNLRLFSLISYRDRRRAIATLLYLDWHNEIKFFYANQHKRCYFIVCSISPCTRVQSQHRELKNVSSGVVHTGTAHCTAREKSRARVESHAFNGTVSGGWLRQREMNRNAKTMEITEEKETKTEQNG